MLKRILSVAAIGILVATAYFFTQKTTMATEVNLYKNPQCGCCENYAEYLRENGFTVTVNPTHELVEMSKNAGIPEDFQGCHLVMIDGYFVSGHVPVDAVRKLLNEKPNIKGITLPGMPKGSPGMGGQKNRPFEIYQISGKNLPFTQRNKEY